MPGGCKLARMKRLAGVVLSLSVLTLAVVRAAGPGPQAAAPPAAGPKAAAPKAAGPQAVRPVAPPRTAAPPVASHVPSDAISTYCVGCHNDRLRRGDLSLATFDISRAAEHPDIAEKVVRKLRLGMMPPKEAARKPDAAISAMSSRLTCDATEKAGDNLAIIIGHLLRGEPVHGVALRTAAP